MKSSCLRLTAVSLVATSLAIWTVPLQSSIDPSPQPHLDALDLQPDEFTLPSVLKGNVIFWRRVYAEWRMNQVALHDAEYPGMVYEIVEVEGDVAESLTTTQSKQIRQRREALEQRLQRIEAAGDNLDALNAEDRALRQTLIDTVGKEAIADVSTRVRAQRGLRERFYKGLELSGRYDRIFRQIFREEGVPEDLAYLPHVESSFQNHARSSVGAAGMWQFTRAAGRTFMTVNRALDQRLDPVAAARGAARYLKQAHDMLGAWPLAVTSYNHGIQGMMRAKNQFGTDFNRIVREYESRSFGFASRNFYAEFLAARQIARNPERYFPEGLTLHRPLQLDSVVLDKAVHSPALARHYAVKQSELVSLNPAWTSRAARGDLAIPAGAMVWLPAGTLDRAAEQRASMTAADLVAAPAEAVTADQSSPAPVTIFHIVRRNESLSIIAQHYDLSVETLRALNDISPAHDVIRVGQKLRVRDAVEPAVGGAEGGDTVIHVVRKGDTPWQIAANYGISLKELLVNNQLTRRSKIIPGQRLEIPVNR